MHIGIDLVDWLILGIGLLASAFVASGSGYCTLELRYWIVGLCIFCVWIWLLDIGIEIVDWLILCVGNDCFYAAAAITIVVDSWGLHKSGGCLHIFVFFVFLFLFFHAQKKNTTNITM